MRYAHSLIEVNILLNFYESLSKGSGDKEWTQKCYEQIDGQMDRHSYEWTFVGYFLC